jgi:hypothetical protein
MKNINKILTAGILMLFLLATLTIALKIENVTQDAETVILDFSFSKPQLEKINIKEEMYDRVTIEGLSNTCNYKEPCLPVKPVKILLPQGKDIENVQVFTSDKIKVGFARSIEMGSPLVHIGKAKVATNYQKAAQIKPSKNPENLFSNVGVYTYRGFSILHLNLYPVQYNSETEEISYFNHIKIIVETRSSEVNRAFRGFSEDYRMIEHLVDNPSYVETYKPVSMNTVPTVTYEYIIITSEEFKNADAEYTFQDLIQSRTNKEMTAGIFTVEEIISNEDYGAFGPYGDANLDNPFYETEITGNLELFDDDSARVRNFIRYAYSELGTSYILLGGDADEIVPEDYIVPYRGLFADEDGLPLPEYGVLEHEEDDIPSDVYFACLDGNFNYDCDMHFGEAPKYCDAGEIDEADLYAEVWVGRACVDSVEEISNFVMKTLWYEQTNDEYLSEILFIGEYLGFPGVSEYGGNYKDYIESKVEIPDTYNVNKIYDRDETWYVEFMIPHLSETPYHLINHDGHGNHYYMLKTSGENIRLLTNEKPFFIYSHSCLTGSFDNYNCWSGYQDYDCIAEVLTCELPYGAFACILNARYGLGSEDTLESPSGAYDESFFKAIFEENIRELGRASHYSKEYHVNRIDENGMRWTYYQTNLFGDPALKIKNLNNAPNKPTIDGPVSGKPGEEYTYTSNAIDPDGDQIWYRRDWGDGQVEEWIGPYQSSEEVTVQHVWTDKGTYTIKMKVKDEWDAESDWATLRVSMPRNKPINIPLINFLENHPHMFPLLRQLLRF